MHPSKLTVLIIIVNIIIRNIKRKKKTTHRSFSRNFHNARPSQINLETKRRGKKSFKTSDDSCVNCARVSGSENSNRRRF